MFSARLKFFLVIIGLSILIIVGLFLYKQTQLKRQSKPSAQEVGTANPKVPALPASPSAQQTSKYVADVREKAKDANTLAFTNCLADPPVFRIKAQGSFTIQNNDDKDIRVAISSTAIYKVPAKKSQSVKMTTEPAIYKYGCSYPAGTISNPNAGVIYVIK